MSGGTSPALVLDHTTVNLPWPPSVNHYWRRTETHKLAITKKGLDFRKNVMAAFLEQHGAGWRQHFDPAARYEVRIIARPPDRRKRDVDNLLKAVLDALETAQVFHDDSQIDDLHVIREQPVKHGELRVTITPIGGK